MDVAPNSCSFAALISNPPFLPALFASAFVLVQQDHVYTGNALGDKSKQLQVIYIFTTFFLKYFEIYIYIYTLEKKWCH